MGALSSFGQGAITFKTSASKNTIYFTTDGTVNSLTPVAADGTAGSLGAVTIEMYTAPNGTALLTQPLTPGVVPAGWTATVLTPLTYTSPGIIQSTTITTPASSGPGGQNVDMAIVAFTGSFASPTSWGYSGSTFNGGSVPGAFTTSTGAISWSQATGGGTPPTPVALAAGAGGLGSIVLIPQTVPEPSTIALGGLGAAALLLFRRRK